MIRNNLRQQAKNMKLQLSSRISTASYFVISQVNSRKLGIDDNPDSQHRSGDRLDVRLHRQLGDVPRGSLDFLGQPRMVNDVPCERMNVTIPSKLDILFNPSMAWKKERIHNETAPISLRVISLKEWSSIRLDSIFSRTSNGTRPLIWRSGCSKSHCWRSIILQKFNARFAKIGQLLCRTISNKDLAILVAFYKEITNHETKRNLGTS